MKRMRTSRRFRVYKEARRKMAQAYPAAFPLKGRRPPLKVGVIKDILGDGSHGLPSGQVRLFLAIWTRSTAYLDSVARGRQRVAIDGTPEGEVSTVHAALAAQAVAERRNGRADI